MNEFEPVCWVLTTPQTYFSSKQHWREPSALDTLCGLSVGRELSYDPEGECKFCKEVIRVRGLAGRHKRSKL